MIKIFISLLITSTSCLSFANLSTAVRGKLESFSYTSEQQGYYLRIKGAAAEELFKSIKNSGGIKDSMSEKKELPEGGSQTRTTIYSDSMSCLEATTSNQRSIEVEYSCEIEINKKGRVLEPARG